jgi:hypothetical protein
MVHAGTHVDLNYPGVEVLVDHEVVTYHLEEALLACNTPFTGLDAPDDDIFDFFLQYFPLICSDIVTKSLHIPHTLIDRRSFMILLNGIVCEMHEFILNVV